ncbi:ATP-binding cassette sub- A member 5 [Branchiostoma belcheri]|nr:ATP-binding cassette sub- A member 5 [Branchiostoma belcheri]
MDCLPADVITKLCTETYLEEEVESAKRLLFDVCKPTERYKKRQGPNKSATNMADILRVLHSMDPSHHCLLTRLQVMRQEMKSIRDISVDAVKLHAELASLRREIVELRNQGAVPTPKKATYAEAASDPLKSVPQVTRVPSDAEPCALDTHERGSATVPKSLRADVSHKPVQRESSGISSAHHAGALRREAPRRRDPTAFDWFRRESRDPAVKVRPSEIFVTRLEPLTQPKDIEQYLNNTLSRKCVVSCVSLQTRYNSYSSFRVAVESDALPDVLAPSCWPNGVLVRRFHGTRPSGPP